MRLFATLFLAGCFADAAFFATTLRFGAAFLTALRFGAAFFATALRFGAARFAALRFGAAFLTALRFGAAFFATDLRFGAAFFATVLRFGAARFTVRFFAPGAVLRFAALFFGAAFLRAGFFFTASTSPVFSVSAMCLSPFYFGSSPYLLQLLWYMMSNTKINIWIKKFFKKNLFSQKKNALFFLHSLIN
jgi:hypothetical protein